MNMASELNATPLLSDEQLVSGSVLQRAPRFTNGVTHTGVTFAVLTRW